jgi:hypothetical protein
MAVAAPALAITRIALAATLVAVFLPAPAQGQIAPCRPPLPALRSQDGKGFEARAYGVARWMQRVASGKRLPYTMHVWTGKVGGRAAYLTFDEIPSTSGPNYHMDYRLKSVPAKIEWSRAARFSFDPKLVVYSGPLAGEWAITNCGAP